MKSLLLFFALFWPLLGQGQAYLGLSVSEIKSYHPYNEWQTDYANNGQKFISTELDLGAFVYYFDTQTGLSNYCIQIPGNMVKLNTQVEIYNKKYVITSNKSWTAYLEGGSLMYIRLEYDDEEGWYYFTYSGN